MCAVWGLGPGEGLRLGFVVMPAGRDWCSFLGCFNVFCHHPTYFAISFHFPCYICSAWDPLVMNPSHALLLLLIVAVAGR